MGSDFSDVRVHNDSRAQDAAGALNARAFTHGSDIWLGPGESQSDTRLMAHEATHVVQQTGSVHRMLVQKAGDDSKKKDSAGKDSKGAAVVDTAKKQIEIPELQIPDFRTEPPAGKELTLKKGTNLERPVGDQEQGAVWRPSVKSQSLASELAKKPGIRRGKPDSQEAKAEAAAADSKDKVYFFKIGTSDNYVIGGLEELMPQFTVPRWDSKGKPRPFDIDHMLEVQLGGDAGIANLQLLDASANRSSGAIISYQVRKTISDAVASEVGPGKYWKDAPDPKDVRRDFDVTWKAVNAKIKPKAPNADPSAKWDANQIKTAEPLKALKPLTPAEVNSQHLLGQPTSLLVYPLQNGGKGKAIHCWDAAKGSGQVPDKEWLRGFEPSIVTYKPGEGGTLSGTVWPKKKKKADIVAKPVTWKLHDLAGQPYTCYIEEGSLLPSIKFAEFRGMSKIGFEDVEIDASRGLVAGGKLSPSLPFFRKGLDLDVTAEGDDITVSKTFSAGDFSLPGPIKVTAASVTLGIGTAGLSAVGDVSFEVPRLGEGKVHAQVSTDGALELMGGFDFDSTLFKPAHIELSYAQNKFSGKGVIGIPAGKVRGIKSATINASIEDGVIDAKGSILPDIPAVEQAELSMHYDDKSGLVIAGDLQLKKDIPGIADGSVHAEVTKKGDDYTVKAHGEATPKIPGISSKLMVSYDDGLFDASGTAGYEKGMLKGSVNVGATNRPVGDDGKPAGDAAPAKADKITIYGSGSLTLQLAPWLQATAGVKFKPDGEVEVTGKIGLPAAINLFDEKKVEKNIFHIGIPIPIVPGVSLNIGGGLDVNAGIGPGQLQEMELDVTYNPAHEEDTKVHGHAALHIPAHAGLRMNVHAALDVGIPLAEVEGGIELGGSLGIEGALHAAVDVDWSPKKGLALDASAEIYGEPKLRFDITGYVKVEVGVGFLSKTLWEKRWELAAIEYGSGLRLGLKMPIHYEEGKPFNPSLSDIQFEVPNVDPMSVLKGLIDKIT